jgi:probable rRNA maturation factor
MSILCAKEPVSEGSNMRAISHYIRIMQFLPQLCDMSATFTDNEVRSRLREKRRLSAFLDQLFAQHRPELRKVKLDYVFCSDAYLLTINQQYLQHDTFTDIITFDLSDSDDVLLGELYISIDMVAHNAIAFGADYLQELHRVIFHGALHLCGFKDKTKADAQVMRQQEQRCLQAYFNQPSE